MHMCTTRNCNLKAVLESWNPFPPRVDSPLSLDVNRDRTHESTCLPAWNTAAPYTYQAALKGNLSRRSELEDGSGVAFAWRIGSSRHVGRETWLNGLIKVPGAYIAESTRTASKQLAPGRHIESAAGDRKNRTALQLGPARRWLTAESPAAARRTRGESHQQFALLSPAQEASLEVRACFSRASWEAASGKLAGLSSAMADGEMNHSQSGDRRVYLGRL